MKNELRRYFINNRKKISQDDKKNWDEKIKEKVIEKHFWIKRKFIYQKLLENIK